MNEKYRFLKGALCGALAMLCIVTAVNGIRGTVASAVPQLSVIGEEGEEEGFSEEKLKRIRAVIDSVYLREDEIDDSTLTEGMYEGYVRALGDPYSVYYTEKEAEELMQGISGEYSGIGAGLSQSYETKIVTITNVFRDSPAEEAGLKSGDILYQVDDHEITDEDLNQVVAWIKGEEGTKVTLHVIRGSEEKEITAVRRIVKAQTVEYEMKDSQIGYIRVTEFDSVTYEQFKAALAELDGKGMKGLVIDLRSNPGGDLDTVLDMLRLILPKGTIISTENKDGKEEEYTCDGKQEFDRPLAVLVNGYSASASEIFSGAVQDYEKGKIVGTTTYGKGVVQEIISLLDGSYIKVTTSEYFLPSGRSINEAGITPDVEVEYEPNEEDEEADNQLDKALEVIREEL